MIKEAVQYLVSLGTEQKPIEKLEYGGRHYTNKELKAVSEPLVTAIKVGTLSGLCDLLSSAKFEGFDPANHLVHVVDYEQAQVVTKKSNHWKQREILVNCEAEKVAEFPFGQFLSHEQFTIGILSRFAVTDDRETILRISSNVTAEAVVTSSDDGVSQQIGVKRGVSLQEHRTIRTVTLAPYRTFREVDQPASDFILRAKQEAENQVPKLALFEADGGKWKLEATENVARYLRVKLGDGVTVVS